MVRWVIGSIPHGGGGGGGERRRERLIELFLIPANAPQSVTKAVVCVILPMGWCKLFREDDTGL